LFRNFQEVLEKAKERKKLTISVAVAQDRDILKAIKIAEEVGLANAILVGNKDELIPLLEEVGFSSDISNAFLVGRIPSCFPSTSISLTSLSLISSLI